MRYPNPWIAIPSLVFGAVAAWVGYVVTDVSCRTEIEPGVISSCPGWAITIAVLAFLIVTIGMLVVMVLVARSIAEARVERE